MAFDWFPECICRLCLNLAGEMRPRTSKGVIQAGLSHGGHEETHWVERTKCWVGMKQTDLFPVRQHSPLLLLSHVSHV